MPRDVLEHDDRVVDDEPGGDTLWELGLDFTVSPGKEGFRGAEEHYRLKGKERFKIFGVKLEGTTRADEGAPLMKDGKKIGVRDLFKTIYCIVRYGICD